MPAGTYENSAQQIPLEASDFFESRMPPQLFLCIIVHTNMKRDQRQELRCTGAENGANHQPPERSRPPKSS